MAVVFQREQLLSLCKMAFLSSVVALSGCGEESPVTNNDNSTNNITNIFDDAPVGVMTASRLCGGPVVLDALGSYDPEGSAISYKWTLVEAPTGSGLAASFTSITTPRVSTLVDKAGGYAFQLTVSADGKQTVTQSVSVFAEPPAAGGLNTTDCISYNNVSDFPDAIRKGVVSARPGHAVSLDATLANDSGATYQWTLVSSPSGSTAVLGGAGTSTPSFTPDVAGDYKLSLAVKKAGQAWAAAVVFVRASNLQAIPLDYAVTRAALITGSNKVASISGDATFRIHDMANGNDYAIALPGNTLDFSISPDGSRALVLQKNMLSLINTSTNSQIASWPMGNGGSSTGLKPANVVMVNNQVAYVYAFDSSNYGRLYPFNAGTGALGGAVSSLSSYYNYGEDELLRFSTDNFFLSAGGASLYKVSLNPDGSVAQVNSVTLPSNCYSKTLLSASRTFNCGAVYSLAGAPPVLTFQSYIDFDQQSLSEIPTGNMVLSADGLGLYAFKNINYYMPGDILMFRTDTWTQRPSIVLPAVESGSSLTLLAAQAILVDTNNPFVVIGRTRQYVETDYYLLRPY